MSRGRGGLSYGLSLPSLRQAHGAWKQRQPLAQKDQARVEAEHPARSSQGERPHPPHLCVHAVSSVGPGRAGYLAALRHHGLKLVFAELIRRPAKVAGDFRSAIVD